MNRLTDCKILIVDDAAPVRAIVRGLLSALGNPHAEEAEDGAVALRMLKRAAYDVVLSDINMPNLNGYDLLRAIKADAALRHLPVLLVMTDARREDIDMAAQNGAAGYLVKPFSKAALHAKLLKALQPNVRAKAHTNAATV